VADLELYEQNTAAFTVAELRALFEYEAAVLGSGLHDCFDAFGVEHVRWHESEFGQDATREMLREHAKMINTWYLALDGLLGDILTCTSESSTYSTAASRYLKAASDEYHRTRQNFEHVTTLWSLALLSAGVDADYPPATRDVSLPMQALTDE
jgi:hypothetical protein